MFRLILLVSLLIGARSFANLGETTFWNEQMEKIQTELTSAKTDCGWKATFEFDKKSFDKTKLEKANMSPYGRCSSWITDLAYRCRDNKDVKAEVAKLTKLTCKMGAKRELKKSGTAVTYTVQLDSSNDDDFFKEWLFKNL